MAAMGRTSRIGSVLFFCIALAVGVTAPPAAATPNAGPGQVSAPQVTWGSCQRFLGDGARDIPTAQCTTVPVPISDADPDWAASTVGRHQDPGQRRAHRRVVRQSRRARCLGGRLRRRHELRAGRQPDRRTLRHRRVRPARSRLLDARGALPHRCRVRRLAAQPDGRLQPRRGGRDREDQPRLRQGMRGQDGRGVPGRSRNRFGRKGYGHRPPGTRR